MKPIILYSSRTGNTLNIVETAAKTLRADILPAQKANQKHLFGRRLVGLASGIYWVRHDKAIFSACDMIPDDCKVFIITTSGFQHSFLIKTYMFMLERKIRSRNLDVIGRWHCPGHDKSSDPLFSVLQLSKGRPDENDLADIRNFAERLMIDMEGA